MNSIPSTPSTSVPGQNLIDSDLFAKGMAVFRIFFGIILFANGVAKLEPEWSRINIGWYHANLVNQNDAKNILNFEVNNRKLSKSDETRGTEVPGVKWITNEILLGKEENANGDVVFSHWHTTKWFLTIFETVVGALLIIGLATRLSALLDLGQQLFLAAIYFSSNRWMFEQPHEYIPLIVLAIVPAGRMWGVDRYLIARYRNLMRWPF